MDRSVASSTSPVRKKKVTFAEFQSQGKKIASLFKPAFELQAQLRKAFLGKAFWKKQTTRRVSVLGNKDVIKLHNELYNRSGDVSSGELLGS